MPMILSAALAAAALSIAMLAEAAIIYEWVDEDGRTQVSDVVPKKYKRTARRVDSARFNVPPKQLKAAQAEAAALKAKAAAAAPKRRPAAEAAPAAAPAAALSPTQTFETTGGPPPVDFADCPAWWRAFVASRDCFAGYQTVRGPLRPGAYQACGPEIPNPEPKCGPQP
jgi:hypothetical protein